MDLDSAFLVGCGICDAWDFYRVINDLEDNIAPKFLGSRIDGGI